MEWAVSSHDIVGAVAVDLFCCTLAKYETETIMEWRCIPQRILSYFVG